MTLSTDLIHLRTGEDAERVVKDNENVVICCGRMGSAYVPIYKVMEDLRPRYPHVLFAEMVFCNRAAYVIKRLLDRSSYKGLPFIGCFKRGEVVHATSGVRTKDQIIRVLNGAFSIAKENGL